jgi:hypothetical protein
MTWEDLQVAQAYPIAIKVGVKQSCLVDRDPLLEVLRIGRQSDLVGENGRLRASIRAGARRLTRQKAAMLMVLRG